MQFGVQKRFEGAGWGLGAQVLRDAVQVYGPNNNAETT